VIFKYTSVPEINIEEAMVGLEQQGAGSLRTLHETLIGLTAGIHRESPGVTRPGNSFSY